MFKNLKLGLRKSEKLSQADLDALVASAVKIYEQDKHGVKVAQLPDGTFLKVFRVKRFWSGAQIYSYARRFCRNVARLEALQIPVPRVLNLYHIASSNLSAVRYSPLAGRTIKDIMQQGQVDEALAYRVGQFIAHVHALGIYFRGLHIGNIVLTPGGDLGLIDVSELSIYWRLSRYRRLRNFARFWRSEEDRAQFGYANSDALVEGYLPGAMVKFKEVKKRLFV